MTIYSKVSGQHICTSQKFETADSRATAIAAKLFSTFLNKCMMERTSFGAGLEALTRPALLKVQTAKVVRAHACLEGGQVQRYALWYPPLPTRPARCIPSFHTP